KGLPVLEDPEDSEEELPKKRERRSPRVRQTRTPKTPVFAQPVMEEEQRRASPRVRRSKADPPPVREELEEAGDEEEEMEEEREIKPARDEGEIPKRRRSSTRAATPQQHKSSPGVRRSPSPPELTQSGFKAAALEAEEASEERVPPLLSLEGVRHRLSADKKVSPVSEKAGTPHLPHSEGSRSHRSPKKWGRQAREKAEGGSETAPRRHQESSFVIRQTPDWHQEAEKAKTRPQELPVPREKERRPITTSKDVKGRPALVLMRPPARVKSEGRMAEGEQSLCIVEKSVGRGVQSMSILEKKDTTPHVGVREGSLSVHIPGHPEVERSEVKSLSVLNKSESEKSEGRPSLGVCGSPESEKTQVCSPVGAPGLTKMRKMKIRTSAGARGQPASDKVKSRHTGGHDLPEARTPDVVKEPSEVVAKRGAKVVSVVEKPEFRPHKIIQELQQTRAEELICLGRAQDGSGIKKAGTEAIVPDLEEVKEKPQVRDTREPVLYISEGKSRADGQLRPARRMKAPSVRRSELEQPSVITHGPSEEGASTERLETKELTQAENISLGVRETPASVITKNTRDVLETVKLGTQLEVVPVGTQAAAESQPPGDKAVTPGDKAVTQDDTACVVVENVESATPKDKTPVIVEKCWRPLLPSKKLLSPKRQIMEHLQSSNHLWKPL
ncbi:hypothetical protein FKM82_024209, partial [Ascaphus truei]